MSILVIGSANIDYVYATESFVKPGETILSSNLQKFYGGKGANQAIAASRLSSNVAFIGAVGNDTDSNNIIQNLKKHNVDCTHILQTSNNCGLAFVNLVNGENSIVYVPGANLELKISHIKSLESYIKSFNIIVLQLEINPDVVEYILKLANKYDIMTILDPAPIQNITQEMLDYSTIVKLNKVEYETLESKNLKVDKTKIILTLGSLGAKYFENGVEIHQLPPRVNVVDSTGAGDVFSGTLAANINNGLDYSTSIKEAIKYSAYSVTSIGAQTDFTK